jgi:class 3 adenylate cyclase
MRSALDTDIRPILPAIHVPTLVLAREWSDHDLDRQIAEEIPNARFEMLPGTERATFAGDQDSLADAIRAFVGAGQTAAPVTTLLRAVLFTDIVSSTEQVARVGDRAWRDVLVAHDERAGATIGDHGGRVVKSTGDGILATFEGPAQAIRAAQSLGTSVRDLGIEIRAGVHVGEIETRGDDVAGVAVHVAARVAALAGASEVFASATVKDLAAGSGLRFEDQGEHELKGMPDRWHLYRVLS